MAGTGADSLARDLSCLTDRQRAIYDWAEAEHGAGRYPSRRAIARHFGICVKSADQSVLAIVRKVGWPCEIKPAFHDRLAYPLTEFQRRVLAWAQDEHRSGRYPSERQLAARFWISAARAHETRKTLIRRKVWPCVQKPVRSGTYGLTRSQQRILAVAWELHDGGEYPSIDTIQRIMEKEKYDNQIIRTRNVCEQKGIWPSRVRRGGVPLSQDECAFLMDYRNSGKVMGSRYGKMIEAFKGVFRRKLSRSTVQRFFRRSGIVSPRPCPRPDIDAVKANVIDERPPGFVLHARDEPAAYRRAVRAGKPDRRRTPSSSRPDCGADVP
jgi:hypothetical protein